MIRRTVRQATSKGLRLANAMLLAALLAAIPVSEKVQAQLDGAGKDQVAAATVLIVALEMEYQGDVPVQEIARVPLGSGILVSADGYVLTNSHVVDTTFLQSDVETEAANSGAELRIEPDFLIYVVDDRDDSPKPRYTATVLDANDTLDLAVLQINGDEDGDPLRQPITDRPPLPLAPPGPVANGDPVHVFGYPVFGDESFSDIGAKSIDVIDSRVRSLEKGPGLRNISAIHLDAAVSGGSSGGAVVNADGQLVGIMTEKLDGTGGAGEAVAIPIDRARGTLVDAGWVAPEPAVTPVATDTPVPATETARPTSTPAPLPTVSPTEPVFPAESLPPEYIATWEGTGVQSNRAEGWPVVITLTGGRVGSVIGAISYPSLGCGGSLTLQGVGAGSVEVSEELAYGLDICTDVGTFDFSLDAGGSLHFAWQSEGAGYVSTGILQTVGANDAPDPSTPVALSALLPTLDEVPFGLVLVDDQVRTLAQSSQVYSDPVDMVQRFEGWGWRGNVLRIFGVADAASAPPQSTTFVAVSIHDFGSATAASEALDYALNDEASSFGQEEIALPPIGERSRAITGRTETGNETLVYIQIETVLIVVSASSPEGDATADAVAIAESILRKMDQLA